MRIAGSLLLMVGFILVFAGVFLPWISDSSNAHRFEGYEVEFYGAILVALSIGLAVGVVIQKPLVSSFMGGLVLAVTLAAAISWNDILAWACWKAYGGFMVICGFQGYGLGFIMTTIGAIFTIIVGLTFWLLGRRGADQSRGVSALIGSITMIS